MRSAIRSEIRSRWPALVGLALAIAVMTAFAAVAATGARRAETALPRLFQQSHGHHVRLGYEGQGEDDDAEVAALLRRPEVEAAGGFAIKFLFPLDRSGEPVGGEQAELGALVPLGPGYGNTFDRPRIHDGRQADPARADEMTLNEALAERLGVGVGDQVELISMSLEQTDAMFNGADPGPPAGPTAKARVVGIVSYAFEVGEGDVPNQILTLTDAFNRMHGDEIGGIPNRGMYRLHDVDETTSFVAAAKKILRDRAGLTVETAADSASKLDESIRLQAIALALFALVMALATIGTAGSAALRQCEATAPLIRTCHALGATRRQAGRVALVPVVAGAAMGALAGAFGAVLASPLTPTGDARDAEPSPGLDVHLPLLALVAGTIVACVAAMAALGVRRAFNAARTPREHGASQSLTDGAARLGLSPSSVVGLGLLAEPGARRGAGSRTVVAGAVIAVAALTAAVVVGASMTLLSRTPRLYGWTPDAIVETNDPEATARLIEDVDGVAAVAVGWNYYAQVEDSTVQFVAVDPSEAAIFPTIVDGRAPSRRDELVLGRRTMRRLDVGIGDRVTVAAERPDEFTVVGQTVTIGMDADQAGEGGVMLLSAAQMVGVDPDVNVEVQGVLVTYDEGADHAAVSDAIEEQVPNAGVIRPYKQGDVGNFDRVRAVPVVLAGLLAFLAATVLVHGLLLGARRAARDLAVLRSLGFVRKQVVGVLIAQATGLAMIALVLGIPAGLLAGRWAWAAMARGVGVVVASPTPFLALALIVAGTLVVANMSALGPALFALHQRPGVTLRKE